MHAALNQHLQIKEQAIRIYQKVMVNRGMLITCLNCDHWDETELVDTTTGEILPKGKGCSLYKAVPPPEVLVYGCQSWIEMIPF